MAKKDSCEIVVILDRSGSMAAIKTDMEGGFDSFVEEQKKAPGECVLTLVQFDSQGIDTILEAKPISEVPKLVFSPRASTPLLDAVGQTVTRTEARIKAMADDKSPDKVLVLVITDGYENASREFKKEQVKALIERITKEHQWAFSYLGANVDAFAESGSLGIGAASSSAYAHTGDGAKKAFAAVGAAAVMMRSSREPAAQAYALTDEQRKQMGGKAVSSK